jgi:hypothetical protein
MLARVDPGDDRIRNAGRSLLSLMESVMIVVIVVGTVGVWRP